MSRKRGQNEGTIFKRKDGRWSGEVSLGNGRRKTVYGRTRTDVVSKIDLLRANLTHGIQPANDQMTVEQLVTLWLEAKQKTVRPTTFEAYSGTIRKHVIPNIGNLKLTKVTPSIIEHFYSTRSKSISAKTVRNLHFMLKQALDWAVRREWLARNPARMIASEDLPQITKKPVNIFSPQQAKALLSAAKGTRSEALITVALTTGVRVGELMGLTWDRVDLQGRKLNIDRALQYRNGEPVLVEPKTRAGRRTLALSAISVEPLRRLRIEQNQRALKLGKAWSNNLDLVFTSETGKPLNRNGVLRRHLRPLLKKAGLPVAMRFHDLRHAAASLLLAEGVPIPIVSEMLGHANPSITMSIYSHALPDSQHIAASAMDATLGN